MNPLAAHTRPSSAVHALERIIVYGNPEKPGIPEVLASLAGWTRARGITLWVERSLAALTANDGARACVFDADGDREAALGTASATPEPGRLVICLGGDGTLIHAVHRLWPLNGTPVMAVNLGSLSFNATVQAADVTRAIEIWQAGQAQISERLVLEVRQFLAGEEVHRDIAVNDVVLGKRSEARIIHLMLRQGGEEVIAYAGDGIILATPTGSTAYNLSAGGPILYPSLQAVVATAICPHTLAVRPVILTPQPPLVLEFTPHHGREIAMVWIDGQECRPAEPHGRVEIAGATEPLRLIHLPGTEYFHRLREKLHWSGQLYAPNQRPR